ncbi:MAG: hypothetical protein ACOX19_01445 [Fermentimonas sp.]|jgi:dienelactone hydrolase
MKLKKKCIILIFLFSLGITTSGQPYKPGSEYLPGTKLLSANDVDGLRAQMIEGMHGYFAKELKASVKSRERHWNRNYASFDEYTKSVEPNRVRFKKITGVVDERKVARELILNESTNRKALVAETDAYTVYDVSWHVLDGVTGTGLWIEPRATVQAQVVILPDADQSPEMLLGLSRGLPRQAQFARELAAAGCRIIIPVLINREDTWSGNPEIIMTNQPHREFIYRRAYEVGRHIIGYEIQKVLAAVDWFKSQSTDLPVAVAGYGEGGLIALYSAAIDTRVNATLVSGYFQEREQIWKEPIYRNVWGLLEEFGDAEIASLIAPRLLVIEACEGPEIEGPPVATGKRRSVAAPGSLTTPSLESIQTEARRAGEVFKKLGVPEKLQVVQSGNGKGLPGSIGALEELLSGLGIENKKIQHDNEVTDLRLDFDFNSRMHDQFMELMTHLDKVIKRSTNEREKFWNKADNSSIERWVETTKPYRKYFHEEIIGKMPSPSQPFNACSRLAYETSKWCGYWVKIDVWPEILAGGILLIPKDIQPGEKRPVVVFQHGLGGKPEPLVDPNIKSAYYSFGSTLADQGYIVYAPQDPYGIDGFRTIQRMANPQKKSLYSVISGQHEQALKWLKQLSFVDKDHFGFYGLSYGGKTAMRVPPILNNYSVVICSGDFNQWVWKTTSVDFISSYMLVGEYEIFEFNFGNTINYAEMAGLIAPKPFMVERGHWDGVAPDEWVAYEYAKVRRLYVKLGIGDRTEIEYFDGPHEIHGVGTLRFLDKYLK